MSPKPDAPPFAAPYRVPCPTCGAAVGFLCQGVAAGMHDARLADALKRWTA